MNLALPQDDLDFMNYDSVVTGLEAFANQIGQLMVQTKKNNAVDRNQVSMLLSVATESHNLQANAFTQRPSVTGLATFVASLEAESDSIIKRLFKAISELVVKIWTSILNYVTGGSDKAQKLQKHCESVSAHAEIIEELPAESDAPDVEQKFQETLRTYTKLTALSLNDVTFNRSVSSLLSKSPAHFEFMELLIKDYIDQVNRGIRSEAQSLTDSEMLKLIRSEVVPAVKALDKDLQIANVGFKPTPLPTSGTDTHPEEIAIVETVAKNATDLRLALSDLRSELSVIHNQKEIDQMVRNVDRLNEFAATVRETLKKVKPLSEKVLQQAAGFENVPTLNAENRQGNKFDEVRLQAEFIKLATRLFAQIEKIGDTVLSDALSFINSVLVLQSSRVKAGLASLGGGEASTLRRKLAARLEAISSKYE